jgi:endo-1,4-beta-mannosidase
MLTLPKARVYGAVERSAVLAPLAIAGQFFSVAGEPWTAIESSEFSLYKRFLDGEDIRPVLEERQAIGFNLLRVWLLNTSVIPRRAAAKGLSRVLRQAARVRVALRILRAAH